MAVTRRQFLTRVAAAGGASLVYEAMTGLGLLAAPSQAPFDLAGRVSGVRVVILGAGLAGMTVAYELGKVGFDCRVLEARARPGGRVFTVRRGTVSEEDGPSQTAAFDDGRTSMPDRCGSRTITTRRWPTAASCRCATEVFVADCESAYLDQTRGPLAGRRIRLREARADFDGYIAELLSKALSQAQLDQPLTAEDRDRVLAYLRRLGALDQQRPVPRLAAARRRTRRCRCATLFGGISDFYVQTDWSSQPTMMQVVGGMDRLPAALAARAGEPDHLSRGRARDPPERTRRVGDLCGWQGQPQRVDADYCVSTIPLPVLSGIEKDLSQPVQSAIAAASYDGAGKIGLQFKRRFWEQDDEIYGGRSWTDQEIGQIIYPSHGLPRPRACSSATTWISADHARAAARRKPASGARAGRPHSPAVRDRVRDRVLRLVAARAVEPRLMAVGIGRGASRRSRRCAQPDGRVHFAGDYMTNMSSWMQGAFESAREVATALHRRALARG